MQQKSERMIWNPLQLIEDPDKHEYAVLLLNQPVGDDFLSIFLKLWTHSVLKVAVDGGTTFLHQMNANVPIPNVVTGDFDSIPPDILQHYRDKGSSVIFTPDQDYTDFTKALRITNETLLSNDKKIDAVIVICQNGGRMDHIMGNLNTLFLAEKEALLPTYLLSSESITWLLNKGNHKIPVRENLLGTCCGLIPLGAPCLTVTTTGLKWNLVNHKLRFGELVSTSNTYDGSDCVTVETDNYLLWTMETRWS